MTISALAAVLLAASPATAKFAHLPAQAVDEVPVARLLANIQSNRARLSPPEKARAIGRLHLLAYLRQAARLPVARGGQDVAEGAIDDCATLNTAFAPESQRGRCVAREYNLDPRPELPTRGLTAFPAADRSLAAATRAYRQARDLEPANLRTRVALAFCLARGGQQEAARTELRFAARAGLRAIAAMAGDEHNADPAAAAWANTVVLNEVADEFAAIARTPADRRLVADLKSRVATLKRRVLVTPILVPLKAGLALDDLIDRASPVAFDYLGQGPRLAGGWPTADAAWLVWDPRGSGRIESGFQLFGAATWVASWDNGYRPLGALDDDGDGRLAGRELQGLALWRDVNGDGVSQPGEVSSLDAAGVVALSVDFARSEGGGWTSPRGVTFKSGETRPTYDWVVRGQPTGAGS